MADFDVVGQERITIVVNPIEHLKKRKLFVIDDVTQIWTFLTHRYLTEVDYSSGQFKSTKLRDKEYTIIQVNRSK